MFKPLHPTRIIADGEDRSIEWLWEHKEEVADLRLRGRGLFDDLPPCIPNARTFFVSFARDIVSLPQLPMVENFQVMSCESLVAIPELPNGDLVSIWGNCPSFELSAGPSSHGNYFVGAKINGHWRFIVANKYFTLADARMRWGKGTNDSSYFEMETKLEGQSEPLALAEEVWRKIVARDPEAAADGELVINPFYRHKKEEAFVQFTNQLPNAFRNLERTVVAFANLRRALNGN